MSSLHSDRQLYPLTTVVPTLGRKCLRGAVEALNRGTIVPDEILICIPENEVRRVSKFDFPNVKIIATHKKGQVFQRSVGFKNATHSIVMQLDDDFYVDRHCVEQLLKTLTAEDSKVAVAPSPLCISSGEAVFKKNENSKLQAFYYCLVNGKTGYQPGAICLSGFAFGVDPGVGSNSVRNVEWLPGGCVMHRRENLILEDFFPFEGKAYSEDLIHSLLLKDRGCKLIVDTLAHCHTEVLNLLSYGPLEFLKILIADYRARKYFVRLSSRSLLRMNFQYIVRLLNYFGKMIVGRFLGFT